MSRPNFERSRLISDALTTIRLLRAGPVELEDIALALGKKRRTAERVIHALQRAGVRVQRRRDGIHTLWHIERADLVEALGLDPARRFAELPVEARPGRALPGRRGTTSPEAVEGWEDPFAHLERWRKSEGL